MRNNNSEETVRSVIPDFPVVGIGASAGGLGAFKTLLKALPEKSGLALVLVQHLDPSHTSFLSEILQAITAVPVKEITDSIKLEPDHVYVVPPNKTLIASDGTLTLDKRPAKDKRRQYLPIDIFFSSLAEVYQTNAIGIVLSGTGSDGTKGLRSIKDHGGITFAQDNSSTFTGMPVSAIDAGVVDFILPPEKLVEKLLEFTTGHFALFNAGRIMSADDADSFKKVLSILHIYKGTEFT